MPRLSRSSRFAGSSRVEIAGLFAAVAVGSIAIGFFGIGAINLPVRLSGADTNVAHTLNVLIVATKLEADLATAMSEARGFALSQGDADKTGFDAAAKRFADDIASLRTLTSDNIVQQEALDQLSPLAVQRMALLRAVVLRAASDLARTPPNPVLTQNARALTTDILSRVARIKVEERRLLVIRNAAERAAAGRSVATLVGSAIVIAASWLLAAVLLIGRRRSQAHVTELGGINTELDHRVADRTRELATSEARQRGYFENSPVGMMVMRQRSDGQFVHEAINPAAEAIHGISRLSAIGHTAAEIWPAAYAKATEQRMLSCVKDRRTQSELADFELLGVTRHVLIVRTLLEAVVGLEAAGAGAAEPARVLVCSQDMTEQRELQRQVVAQAAMQLEAAEREMALFANSADALFVVGVEEHPTGRVFRYQSISPAYQVLTGIDIPTVLGHTPQQCFPPDVAVAASAAYNRCVIAGHTISYNISTLVPLGARDFESSVTPIRDAATGQITRLVGAMRDVTERRQLEQALLHGQKMEAIGRLSAGVAHDFNNILQSIIGSLEFVMDEVGPGTPACEFAGIALSSARRGADLTQHLLAYARKQILLPRIVDPKVFLPAMQKLLTRTLGTRITVRLQVDLLTPCVRVDPGQLETALVNLAINASHAMPNGGLLVLAAGPRDRGDAHFVSIVVTDNGCGIDRKTLAQVFDPFFTTKGLNGTGLGLSMVQGFAEQSGGTVGIESEPGQGTSVELCLPAQMAEVPPVPAPLVKTRQSSGRLLLVDDNADILLTTGKVLEAAGFQVARASSGDRALALLAADPQFDAMVTDYAMPGMSGVSLIEQARLIKPELPALLITGFITDSVADGLDGSSNLLRKPFKRADLVAAVNAMMRHAAPLAATSNAVASDGAATG